MHRLQSTTTYFLTLILFLISTLHSAAAGAQQARPDAAGDITPPEALQVTLSAAQTTTSWDSRLLTHEPFELPLLTLHQQRQATDPRERTLRIHIAGLAGGTPVELEARSWHEHPSTGTPHGERQRATLPNRPCTAAAPCTLDWTLDAATAISDFYRFTLRDGDGALLWQNPIPEQPDFVALDRWEFDIQPYTVRILYGALFFFARGEQHVDERLAPQAVHAFVGEQIVPTIVDAWRTQFDAWGFGPIHPQWDADHIVEVVFTCPPFALQGGTGTYTISTYADGTPYPERRVWIRANDEVLEHYDSLETGFKIILSHEFFHLAQWNVRLSAGQSASTWRNVIVEAQAIAASSIQYPEIELSRAHLSSTRSQYSASADRFLERRLKTPYAALEAEQVHRYDAALYWRFLYERYGDLHIYRRALEEMTRQPAAEPAVESAASLDAIMDATLGHVTGPFDDYEQSLTAYARANVALRLENGRCASGDPTTCGERYYDPHRMYTIPPCEASLTYRGETLSHDGSIPASFGADLIQVSLDSDPADVSLAISFRSEGARFSVQVWKLQMDDAGPRNPARGLTGLHAMTPQPETLAGACDVECHLTIQDLDQVDRLALIVVRLDAHEEQDPQGAYQLSVD